MRSHEIFESLADDAAEHFGVTNNPRECGYLLPDGRMLDLSGKHWLVGSDYRRVDGRNVLKRGDRDYQSDVRQVDHRDLDHLSQESGGSGMLKFMRDSGAIRVMPPIGFNFITPPTRKQIAMMCTMAKYFDPEVYLEVYDADGYSTGAEHFTDLTPLNIMRFIEKHASHLGAPEER